MRLSSTDIYACQALGYLGIQPSGRWTGSEEISDATGVARPYLVRVLAMLSAVGIVSSKKASAGVTPSLGSLKRLRYATFCAPLTGRSRR